MMGKTAEVVTIEERGGDYGVRFAHRLCGACEGVLHEDLEEHNLQKRPVLTNHQQGGYVVWIKKVQPRLLDEIADEIEHAITECAAGNHA